VKAGRTIDAIKLYRRIHGADLKTAKDAIDKMHSQQGDAQSRTER
jgi:ribosomal protein L7/L12